MVAFLKILYVFLVQNVHGNILMWYKICMNCHGHAALPRAEMLSALLNFPDKGSSNLNSFWEPLPHWGPFVVSFSPILVYLLLLSEKLFFLFTVSNENGVHKVARLICYPLMVKDGGRIYSFYDAFFELLLWSYIFLLIFQPWHSIIFVSITFFGSRNGSEAIESALVGNLSRHKGPVSFTISLFCLLFFV